MALGIAFGDKLFTGFEDLLGEPLDDLILALGGGVVGGLAHEIVANLLRRKS
jgi:hypothetical protein